MSHSIPEATPENLMTIQAQVLLFETRSLLERTHGVRNFKLEYKIEGSPSVGGDGGHYIVLKREGHEETQAYLHPVHGDAKSVAYLLSLTSKPIQLAGR